MRVGAVVSRHVVAHAHYKSAANIAFTVKLKFKTLILNTRRLYHARAALKKKTERRRFAMKAFIQMKRAHSVNICII